MEKTYKLIVHNADGDTMDYVLYDLEVCATVSKQMVEGTSWINKVEVFDGDTNELLQVQIKKAGK